MLLIGIEIGHILYIRRQNRVARKVKSACIALEPQNILDVTHNGLVRRITVDQLEEVNHSDLIESTFDKLPHLFGLSVGKLLSGEQHSVQGLMTNGTVLLVHDE